MTGFQATELSDLLDGYYKDQLKPDTPITDFEFSPIHLAETNKKNYCFISISNDRWNQVHQKKTTWKSGNKAILPHYHKCKLIITEEPIKQLNGKVPQLIVKNSYKVIGILAEAARHKMSNPVIGITGSVGKSSTRLMLEHLLNEDYSIIATRGNHNTQVGVPLYGAKLCQNPDIGLLEISLNALNNRGNQALLIQPDICIVTSIGEAHLSTLHTTENIARFKARIFAGLKPGSLAIINHDINQSEFDILYQKAKERTDRIKTYSMTDIEADLYLKEKIELKYNTTVTFTYKNRDYQVELSMPSKGTIENALGVFLCLAEMGVELHSLLYRMVNFQSLDRVMELKKLETKDGRRVDIIDDSHNAAIPSMMNAIRAFKDKQRFYKGNSILVLGQVADLGDKSKDLHQSLLPEMMSSGADYIFGHGEFMRNIIKQIPANKVGGWFNNAMDLSKRIPLYCSDDSLILLKGSVSGSDFQTTSHLLPNQIKHARRKINAFNPASIVDVLQPMYGITSYNLDNKMKIYQAGSYASNTIEGISPIILISLLLKKQMVGTTKTTLSSWATNKGSSMYHKPFKTGTVFTHQELLDELMNTQHPSATFQLAHDYFRTRNNALKEINKVAKKEKLTPSATLNLTGRYRVKEQQSYNLIDLYKIGLHLEEYKLQLPSILSQSKNKINGIIFGETRLSFIGFYKNKMICMIGVKSIDMFSYLLHETIQNSDANSLQKENIK